MDPPTEPEGREGISGQAESQAAEQRTDSGRETIGDGSLAVPSVTEEEREEEAPTAAAEKVREESGVRSGKRAAAQAEQQQVREGVM